MTTTTATTTSNTKSKSKKEDFPFVDIIPKNETNVLEFIKKYPEYDGRDVVIGILDTGVDPNAFGLSKTTEGKVKLVNTIDCTGSGDVLLSDTKAKLIEDTTDTGEEEQHDSKTTSGSSSSSYWEVTGLTGRTLKLNPNLILNDFPTTTTKDITSTATTAEEEKKDDDEKKEDKKEEKAKATTDTTAAAASNNKKVVLKEGPLRLGIKRAYELFPTKLINRVKAYRKTVFEKDVHKHILKLKQELVEWSSSSVKDKSKPTHEEVRIKNDIQSKIDVLQESINSFLDDDPGPLYDCIVYYDSEDKNYRVIIDVNEDGNLLKIQKGMTDYYKENEWSTFSFVDQYNYAINFYDDGTVLNIVTDAGAHGSHVAGIASSYYDAKDSNNDDSSNNDTTNLSLLRSGVAPGAQIISFKIGDTRLGSMETGSSLIRALIMAIKLKVDVINLSYGEGSVIPNSGRFIELAEELVYKHNIVFVSSAGNNGPALSTVGAPGGTTSAILGISAYVSSAMMKTEYSMISSGSEKKKEEENDHDEQKEQLLGSTYTWSSVGPTVDGDVGVNVTSPGGAITSVPNWTLQKTQLMNGTSMSSPHATGCIALLLSACKASGIKGITPTKIKRCIENTAKFLPNLSSLQQGCGMIQVDKAWDYIITNYANKSNSNSSNDTNEEKYDYDDVYFNVSIDNHPNRPRGIYLRQGQEVQTRQTFSINVKPNFRTSNDITDEIQKCRINYETHFNLYVSTVQYNYNEINDNNDNNDWISIPNHFILMHSGRSFKIDVDPTKLSNKPGVHTARIIGVDSQNPDKGPMFIVPITVTIPINNSNVENNDEKEKDDSSIITLGELEFESAEVKRYFVNIPAGVTWMDITLRDGRSTTSDVDDEEMDSSSRLIVLHTVQLLQHAAYRDYEVQKYFNLLPGQTTVSSIPVHSGVTCEIDLARYWSALGVTKVHASIRFRGIQPKPNVLQMTCSGGGGGMVRLSSPLNDEMINPTAKLTKWKTPLRPTTKSNGDNGNGGSASSSSLITPLGERDVLPSNDKRIYQLVLTYEFNQEEAGSIVVRAPALQGVLYESAYESQLILIFDGDKKYLGVNDAWPGEVKVPKGNTVIRVQIRHDDTSMLEKLKDMTIWIERKLEKDIPLSAYNTKEAMMIGKDTMKKRTMRKGTTACVFFAEPAHSKLPTHVKCGDVIFGLAYYGAGDATLPGDGKRPGGYAISFVVGPKPADDKSKSKDEAVTPDVPDERSVQEKLDEAVRDLKVGQLDKLSSKEKEEGKFEELYSTLEKEYSHHIPLLMASLKYYDTKKPREKNTSLLQSIIDASNKVITEISEDELALHFGKNHDKEDPKSCKERKQMDEKKSFLIEALARKARAVAEIDNGDEEKSKDEEFDSILKQLKCWIDIDSSHKYAVLVLEREKRAKRYGTMLKLLNSLLKNKGDDTKGGICPLTKSDLLMKRAAIFEQLGYTTLVEHDKKCRCISNPKDYLPF